MKRPYGGKGADSMVGGDGAIFHDGPALRQSFTVDFGSCSGNIWLQNYSVDTLDRLIVRLVTEELAKRAG